MAVSSTPSRAGGRRPVDAALNLVPFIDLLSCCIAFLLITAVWSQVAAIEVSQGGGGDGEAAAPLVLSIDPHEYRLTRPDGSSRTVDAAQLTTILRAERGAREDLLVAPVDGVSYQRLVGGLDAARAAGFVRLALGPS